MLKGHYTDERRLVKLREEVVMKSFFIQRSSFFVVKKYNKGILSLYPLLIKKRPLFDTAYDKTFIRICIKTYT